MLQLLRRKSLIQLDQLKGKLMESNFRLKIFIAMVVLLFLLTTVCASASNIVYVYTDAQGTPIAEADRSGAISATFDYRPYGVLETKAGSNDVGYTGHVSDLDTNLVYMQARYYDPQVGRFISIDPLSVYERGIFGFNRFSYVENNPIVKIDFDGREAACVSSKAGCYPGNTKDPANDAISGYVYGVASAVANKWNGIFHDGTPEGEPIKPDTESQSAGMTTGGIVLSIAITVITEGEKGPSDVNIVAPKALDDSAIVCRGGQCMSGQFSGGTGVTLDANGNLQNVSVNSANGKSLKDLTKSIQNNQVGVTTVGQIRAAGGDVVPSPSIKNPYHATMSGLSPQKAQDIFNPTIRNPSK